MGFLNLISALLNAPVPSILTLAGLVFIFLSFFKVKVIERVEGATWLIRLVGLGLTALGAALFIIAPTPGASREAAIEQESRPGQIAAFNCPAHERVEATTGTVAGRVDIDSPKGGAVVPHQNSLMGTYEDVPQDVDLWVMVYSPSVDRFYPQAQDDPPVPAAKVSSTTWAATVFVGLEDGSLGECFDIIVVAADREGSQSMVQILDEWNDKGAWPGLTPAELPAGIEEKDAVTVQRGY